MKRQTSILAQPRVATLGMVLFGSIFAIVGVVATIFLLIRERTWYGLMPLLFTASGLFFIRVARQMKAKPWLIEPTEGRAAWLPVAKHRVEGGRVILAPTMTPLAGMVAMIAITLFWNGIVSVFLYLALESHLKGDPEWFMTVFMIPFALVGLLLLGLTLRQILAVFNPTIEMTLNRAEAPPGEALQLSWQIHGNVGRLKKLKILLVGEESAIYRRGTDTITERHEFRSVVVYESDRVGSRNSARVEIPDDAMHSFKTDNNGIEWKLKVRGDVPRWPDLEAEYEFIVVPKGMANG
jgi:hypothetical protein